MEHLSGVQDTGPAAVLLTGCEKGKSFLVSLSPYFKSASEVFWDLPERGIVIKGLQVKLSILIFPLIHWGGQIKSFVSFEGAGGEFSFTKFRNSRLRKLSSYFCCVSDSTVVGLSVIQTTGKDFSSVLLHCFPSL